MEVLDNIYQHCDNHDIVIGIHLDLQEAFITVNHSVLVGKLNIYGVRDVVLNDLLAT